MALRDPREAPTLVRRLTVRLALASGVALAFQFAVLVWDYGFDEEEMASYMTMHALEEVREGLAHDAAGRATVRLPTRAEARYRDRPDAYAFRVLGPSGATLAERNPAVLAPLRLDATAGLLTRREDTPGGSVLIGVERVDRPDGPVQVVVAARGDSDALFWAVMRDEGLIHVGLSAAPMLILTFGVSVWALRGGLRPLSEAARSAAAVDPRRPGGRLPERGLPREVLRLVRTVNASLARVDDALDAQRRFMADAAHELRTPLAVLTLGLDRVAEARAADGRAEDGAAGALADEVERMTRTVNQLLAAARLDAGAPEPARAIDLAALARGVVARLAPLALDRGRWVEFVDLDPAAASGDPDLLADGLRNLIENALRHAPAGTAVRVTAGPGARLAVDDAGPGVPPADRELIFEPFRRGPGRHGEGAGLGLSIVRRIASAHGGAVAAGVSPEGGARFTMTLGTAATAEADAGRDGGREERGRRRVRRFGRWPGRRSAGDAAA